MKKILASLGLYAFPVFVFAQGLTGAINTTKNLLDLIIPIIITLAVIYFFYGLAKYILASGDEQKSEGRSVMIYGLIALFVMVSVWGLVALIGQTFGINSGTGVNLPTVPAR